MLRKYIILSFLALQSLGCFSQNYLAQRLSKYENCFYGKVVKSKLDIMQVWEEKGCTVKDTIKIKVLKKIKGNFSLNQKEIEIPYERGTFHCMHSYVGRTYGENKNYLFFSNDFESIKGNKEFSHYEIKPENEKKQLKLIDEYLKTNSKSDIVDWSLNYANELNYKDGLRELFQHKYSDYKFSFAICSGNRCNCKNSYKLNKQQLKTLRKLYLKQQKLSYFDICVLTELNNFNDKELLKATQKRLENYKDIKYLINKPLIKCITQFSNNTRLIEISKKLDTIKYRGTKEYKLLLEEYIEIFMQ